MKLTLNGDIYPNERVRHIVDKVNSVISGNISGDVLNGLTGVLIGVFLQIKENGGINVMFSDLKEFEKILNLNLLHNIDLKKDI